MTELAPSYLVKISRAKKHLADLRVAIAEYGASRPYKAVLEAENKKKTWRVRFVVSPMNTQIPVISADLVYNIRSGLEHLAAALNPRSHASHVGFPIFEPGIWTDPGGNANQAQKDAYQRWCTYTRKMQPGAVEILKGLQPEENDAGQEHWLTAINQLSNTDRHQWFPVYACGLYDPVATQDGKRGHLNVADVPAGMRSFLHNGADITFPGMPTQVEISGTPMIAIRRGGSKGFMPIPEAFDAAIDFVETEVIAPLLPFVVVETASATARNAPKVRSKK